MRGIKIKRDLMRAACLLAPTMSDQRAFVDIQRVSEDAGDDESTTIRKIVAALHRGMHEQKWPSSTSH